MCVRGLKQIISAITICCTVVARRVRAWIETAPITGGGNLLSSHAVCVRGLKLKKNHSIL